MFLKDQPLRHAVNPSIVERLGNWSRRNWYILAASVLLGSVGSYATVRYPTPEVSLLDRERYSTSKDATAWDERTAEVCLNVRRLRAETGLSRKDLADIAGTTESVIQRLEEGNFDGHSFVMLQRIAAALGRRVTVTFPPAQSELGTLSAVATEVTMEEKTSSPRMPPNQRTPLRVSGQEFRIPSSNEAIRSCHRNAPQTAQRIPASVLPPRSPAADESTYPES